MLHQISGIAKTQHIAKVADAYFFWGDGAFNTYHTIQATGSQDLKAGKQVPYAEL
jgi:hypothetical protein